MELIDRFSAMYRDFANLDLNQLGKIYTLNVEFIDPVDTHQGLDALQDYFRRMMDMVELCEFDIHGSLECQPNPLQISHVINWTMRMRPRSSSKLILLNGVSQLKVNDQGIYFQRDYYDLGEMVYEHVPALGWVIQKVKGRLRA